MALDLKRDGLAYLRYLRNTLADHDRKSLKTDAQNVLSFDDVQAGLLSQSLTNALFEAWSVHQARSKKKTPANENGAIPVALGVLSLAPKLTVTRKSTRVETPPTKTVLWVPALLDVNGYLRPYRDRIPWISRNALEPTGEPGATVASVEEYDEFLRATSHTEFGSWAQVMSYTEQLVRTVMRQPLPGFELIEHTVHPPFVQIYPDEFPSAQALVQLYDRVIENPSDARSSSMWAFFLGRQVEPLGPVDDALHVGQMEAAYGLSSHQRSALQAHLVGKDGEIQAVNGPPGTGKTTLLQSTIATSVVETALNGADPRIILACSTNNQAITNIQDSFAKVRIPEDHFLAKDSITQRWLPDVTSYALYLPATTRVVDDSRPSYARFTNHSWEGLPAKMQSREYVSRAAAYYIQMDTQRRGKALPVESIVSELQAELRGLKRAYDTLIAARGRLKVAQDKVGGEEAVKDRNGRLAEFSANISELQAKVDATIKTHDLHAAMLDAQQKCYRLCSAASRPQSVVEKAVAVLPGSLQQFAGRSVLQRFARLRDVANRNSIGHLIPKNLAPLEAMRAFLGAIENEGKKLTLKVQALREEIARLKREQAGLITNQGAALAEFKILEEAEQRWRDESAGFYRRVHPHGATDPHAYDDADALLRDLDTNWRFYMFQVASRYWEGRWLLDMAKLRAGNDDKGLNGRDKGSTLARYRRFSMVTPLLVSTFHMAPRYFSYFAHRSEPLFNAIDWLIVDEAGQVSPEIGMPTFALAKRALVVGDTFQIEPVWNTISAIDEAMLREVALFPRAAELTAAGYRTFGGSLMSMAKEITARSQPSGDGVMLVEHRRCYDPMVAFCNDLVYKGALAPLRGEPPPKALLPAMGYAYVAGETQRVGGSWRNPREARLCAEWLSSAADRIVEYYKKHGRPNATISDLVSIITPFKAQVAEINRQLKTRGLKDIDVGTVHAFQGAEFPVVIFLPVYTKKDAPYAFINNKPNILNVAVSRAQDSFIYFGDVDVLQSKGYTEILGKHLFARPTNAILDVGFVTSFDAGEEGVRTLTSISEHRALLEKALTDAKDRLLIVGSYVKPVAGEGDNLVKRCQAAVQRGVQVTVVTDARSIQRPETDLIAFEALKRTGADVHIVRAIPRNVLTYDRVALCEGAVNWFAVDHAATMSDLSYLYFGSKRVKYIDAAWNEVLERTLRPRQTA